MPTRILTKRFTCTVLAAMLPLCLVLSAVSGDSVPAANQYETPGRVSAEDFLPNDSSRKSLRKRNEQKLSELGVNQDLIAEFLNHPWYSPRQEAIITTALSKAGIDLTIFLEAANKGSPARMGDTLKTLRSWPPTRKRQRPCSHSDSKTD